MVEKSCGRTGRGHSCLTNSFILLVIGEKIKTPRGAGSKNLACYAHEGGFHRISQFVGEAIVHSLSGGFPAKFGIGTAKPLVDIFRLEHLLEDFHDPENVVAFVSVFGAAQVLFHRCSFQSGLPVIMSQTREKTTSALPPSM